LSFFLGETRPWKATLLVPSWPVKVSLPAVTARPLTRRVKLKVTVASSLSENENVVPIGAFARLTVARRLPSRHLVFDWRTFCTTRTRGGFPGSGPQQGGLGGSSWAAVVKV
jgi:hypothetical protein